MAKEATIDLDKTIEHALSLRPSATPAQIRTMVPLAASLHENELAARVQRLRSRVIRKSKERSRLINRTD